jgi:glyoxylase-like metal-dependent hydrolase (beta-lactamase superfamily II)|tara:strand:+ start:260 stop:1135 length:876 start_codon:yes stop_codon:yes gene_type:complete
MLLCSSVENYLPILKSTGTGNMAFFICKTCGVEFSEQELPPETCPICLDPRQYVGWDGQQWTTMKELKSLGYRNDLRTEESGLIGIGIEPSFSIGQRALLIESDEGNILFDCVSLIDEETVIEVNRRGGIRYICFSHPHFYDSMVSWSRVFDDATIIVPHADKQHVMRHDSAIQYWDGLPLELVSGVTLIQTGGHFKGSSVLHWKDGASGKGALLVGDTITVVPDKRFVSFMTSYPNLIPMSKLEILNILSSIEPFDYDRIYGGWWGRNVLSSGKTVVRNSAKRYIRHISK